MKAIAAEFLGTAGLLIVVVGSGIMGESLSGGNAAIALLANSLATGAGLYALIQTFGCVSGAHFNPAVTLTAWLRKDLVGKSAAAYLFAQVVGGLLGVWVAHFMFGLSIAQVSENDRTQLRFFVSEIIATFGLILAIAQCGRRNPAAAPSAVALYIMAAYWCTSSTSFANPAVTLARCWTNTFSGINPSGLLGFVGAQIVGALLAFGVADFLERGSPASSSHLLKKRPPG